LKQINPLVFVLTVLGMAVIGVACGGLGAYLGAHVFGSDDFLALGMAIVGMLTGYAAGNVAGLVLVKYVFKRDGSVVLGIAGAVVWTAIAVGVAALLNLAHDASSWVVSLAFLLTPVAALLGFHLKRAAAS